MFTYYNYFVVFFRNSMYSVNEDDKLVQPVLILSDPLSTNITVEVFSTDGSATGEWQIVIAIQTLNPWYN